MVTKNESHAERRIVIVTGGSLGAWALAELAPEDVLVGADRGALFLLENGYTPDWALGDFDSIGEADKAWIRSASRGYEDCDPVWKDHTDTEMAFHWALAQSPSSMLLIGALGTRFDHTLANVHLLKYAADAGIPCSIIGEHNEISLVKGPSSITVAKGRFDYISLLPLDGEASGITLKGFLYPLDNASLRMGQSLGISNVLTEKNGSVEVKQGYLLVIQSCD